jgi:hypothetical protein
MCRGMRRGRRVAIPVNVVKHLQWRQLLLLIRVAEQLPGVHD